MGPNQANKQTHLQTSWATPTNACPSHCNASTSGFSGWIPIGEGLGNSYPRLLDMTPGWKILDPTGPARNGVSTTTTNPHLWLQPVLRPDHLVIRENGGKSRLDHFITIQTHSPGHGVLCFFLSHVGFPHFMQKKPFEGSKVEQPKKNLF